MLASDTIARPSFTAPCAQCGDALIAPECSEHVSERFIRHLKHLGAEHVGNVHLMTRLRLPVFARALSVPQHNASGFKFAQTMRRLATVHRELGELASARRVLEEALEGAQLRLRDDDPVVLGISADLGSIADELGNRHEARRNFTRVARYATVRARACGIARLTIPWTERPPASWATRVPLARR